MSSTETRTCPLCSTDAPATALPAPPVGDKLVAQEAVLSAIEGANPDWVAEDGACTRCWEEYSKL
jgi:hypothetical protein